MSGLGYTDAFLDAYKDEKNGKQAFVALTYPESEKLGNHGAMAFKALAQGAFVFCVAAGLSFPFLCFAFYDSYLRRDPSDLISTYEILLSMNVSVSTYTVCNAYSEIKSAAKQMLETEERPINAVGTLLPKIPDNEVEARKKMPRKKMRKKNIMDRN